MDKLDMDRIYEEEEDFMDIDHKRTLLRSRELRPRSMAGHLLARSIVGGAGLHQEGQHLREEKDQ